METQKAFQRQAMGIDKFRHLLNTFIRSVVIHLRNCHELWFQQDGVTCHAANEIMDVMQGMLSNNIISRRAAPTRPARSPDLNDPEYYL